MLRQPLAENGCGSLCENGRNKAVTVHPGAFYSHEKVAGLYLPAVDVDASYLTALLFLTAHVGPLTGAGDLV